MVKWDLTIETWTCQAASQLAEWLPAAFFDMILYLWQTKEGPVVPSINKLRGSESRGGRPGLSVITSLLVSVDVKNYWTMLWHWSQLVPNMSTDIWGHSASTHHHVCNMLQSVPNMSTQHLRTLSPTWSSSVCNVHSWAHCIKTKFVCFFKKGKKNKQNKKSKIKNGSLKTTAKNNNNNEPPPPPPPATAKTKTKKQQTHTHWHWHAHKHIHIWFSVFILISFRQVVRGL